MAILLVSHGEVLHPDCEADARSILARAGELRFKAAHHERQGQEIQARVNRSMARVLEDLVGQDLIAQIRPIPTAEPGDDTPRHPPMVRMALAGLRNGAERRHQ